MEKTISVEERIRRAEEIYERRNGNKLDKVQTINLNKEKKDVKLLKKMIIQIIICSLIYIVIYIIQRGEYVFSKDFISRRKQCTFIWHRL